MKCFLSLVLAAAMSFVMTGCACCGKKDAPPAKQPCCKAAGCTCKGECKKPCTQADCKCPAECKKQCAKKAGCKKADGASCPKQAGCKKADGASCPKQAGCKKADGGCPAGK